MDLTSKKMRSFFGLIIFSLHVSCLSIAQNRLTTEATQPNIIIIYADDLGYGDVSCYGATKIETPNIDKLAASGLRFTRAYSTSATCTPSRYSMLTGKYAWRQSGTGIARGNAGLIIPDGMKTLPSMLKTAGYRTGVVGKWHLGLGGENGPDWNNEIKPGPLDIGFDESFILPATGDRVPCVYVRGNKVVDLDPADPIQVSYGQRIGQEPTGAEHPELLKMKFSHGHDQTIVNGISRIGFMTGGKSARWIDEDMADVLTGQAVDFIRKNKAKRFFLYFSTHDIHVPRVPHTRFGGKSGMGPRGDAILQLDWSVGEIMKALGESELSKNTIVIFTSDNGPVVDDGYEDDAVEKLKGHTPSGPFRGGKYSAFEAGTRVPFIVHWPSEIKPGLSEALISQIDLYASLGSLAGRILSPGDAPDSFDNLHALTGKTQKGRDYVIQQSLWNVLSVVREDWKYISPSKGPARNSNTNIESGNSEKPQLYNLRLDPGETTNIFSAHPQVVRALGEILDSVRQDK